MKNLERTLWIVSLLVAGLLYLNERQQVEQIELWVEQQNSQLLRLDSLISGAISDTTSNVLAQGGNDWLFDSDYRYLASRGIDDPLNELKDDLIIKPEIIPYDAVLGGKMGVYSKNQIRILPGRYTYALFEDGHIQGAMLLQYDVKNGEIIWEIIVSRLF